MTIELVPYHLIDHNPWQTRPVKLARVAELAESIKENGLLQEPKGRHVGDRIQLQFGHHRHAAWAEARPGEPMPVDVQDITDRQMAERAAIENAQRDDLSAIEKALSIQRLIADFGMTQAEAGKLFRINTQGGVSNLLRLLKLPEPMRQLVDTGDLPERIARRLLSYAQVNPTVTTKMAHAIAKADDSQRDSVLAEQQRRFHDTHGQRLHDLPWKSLAWPEQPIAVNNPAVKTIPACQGCPARVEQKYGPDICLNKTCYAVKSKVWADAEAIRIAQKLHLVADLTDKPGALIFTGSQSEDLVARALATKHASLRIVPFVGQNTKWDEERARERILGSRHVALVTTDSKALSDAIAEVKLPKQAKAKRQLDKWEIQQERRRKEQRARLAIDRKLVQSAAPHLAGILPTGPLLDVLFQKLQYDFTPAQRKT
jgi:ParB/RepB/Spo0J family partition protein